MNRHTMVVMALLVAGTVSACSKGGEKVAQQTQKPPVAVEVLEAVPREMVESIDVTGNMEPKFYADVRTQIPGLVRQVYVTEWVRVRKGAPLARIDVAETEAVVKRTEASVESAKANLAQAQVNANRAEREMARTLKLKEAGLATQQSVDDSRTEAEAAVARIDAAKAQIRVAEEEMRQARARQAKGLVTSPLDGMVALRDVNVGDLASDAAAGKPIFRIVDNRILNLTVSVPSAESSQVKVGQPLEFTVDALPGKVFSGRVMFINPELGEDRSLKVIAEVRNPDEILKGGLFAKGRIITGQRPQVVQVPRSALVAWDTAARKARLFIVSGDQATVRPVETGAVNGEMVEIIKGIAPGEKFVVRGGFSLTDSDKVAVTTK